MKKRCNHEDATRQYATHRAEHDRTIETLWCPRCKTNLSLGPANMTDEAKVELRAAEIAADAADWPTTKRIEHGIAMTNIGGPRSDAARLAREIIGEDGMAELTEAVCAAVA